jgi:predicted nucleic acid-binding protein
VVALLLDPNTNCYAHAINIAEVFYITERTVGKTTAQKTIANLISDGIVIREDMDAPFWEIAASLKSQGGISLPDCFCIALAQRIRGIVVTSDHAEFDPIDQQGIIPIHFIR